VGDFLEEVCVRVSSFYRKVPKKILLTLLTNELINPTQFIPIYTIQLHHETIQAFVKPSSLFSSSNKSLSIHMHVSSSFCFPHPTKSLSSYTCMSLYSWCCCLFVSTLLSLLLLSFTSSFTRTY
jgi:hypothetical protein